MKTLITLCLFVGTISGLTWANEPAIESSSITPVDVDTLPQRRRRSIDPLVRRPMIEVGTGVDTVSGLKPRMILRVAYSGLGRNPNPYADVHYFAIDSEIGLHPNDSEEERISRVSMRFTPIRIGIPHGWNENFHLNNLAVTIAPVTFDRELALGVRERIEVSLMGVQFENLGIHEDDHLTPIYFIFRASSQALGYAFQNLSQPTDAETEGSALSIVSGRVETGLGFMLGQDRFCLDVVFDARAATYLTQAGLGANYEIATEFRFIFNGDPQPDYPGGLGRGGRQQQQLVEQQERRRRGEPPPIRHVRVSAYVRWTMNRTTTMSVGPDGQTRVRSILGGLDVRF